MKKPIIIVSFLIFLIATAMLGSFAFRTETTPARQMKADNGQTNQMFNELGINKVPHSNARVEFNLSSLSGEKIQLSDYKGKIVFLNFWASWCPACRAEMPAMQRLHAKLEDKDFVMVSVNLQESVAQVKNFFDTQKLTFTALLDSNGSVARKFGVRALPTTFILDQGGRIIGKALGVREWDSKEVVALFRHLMQAT